MQKLAIIGSTGSIGRQTLDVVSAHTDILSVELLTANDNWELLAQQARQFDVNAVVIVNASHYERLKATLSDTDIKVYCSAEAIEQEVQNDNINVVVTAISGFAGMRPTIAAIKAGKKIALANKETLVVGGELVVPLAQQFKAPILPVDSEHSAIFQCLVGEADVKRVILTASGGALRDMPIDKLCHASVEQVLKHPSWLMGDKITVDSATMLNKGFEVIEAKWLFGVGNGQIDVVIHPQSIIHSMVEFEDGSIKAQMGCPDMRLPIQYALTFPKRLPLDQCKRYNPYGELTFEEVDYLRYPCLKAAYDVMNEGGIAPTVLNAAGEIAVKAFLKSEIGYCDIYKVIEKTLNKIENQKLESFEQICSVDKHAREVAEGMMKGV